MKDIIKVPKNENQCEPHMNAMVDIINHNNKVLANAIGAILINPDGTPTMETDSDSEGDDDDSTVIKPPLNIVNWNDIQNKPETFLPSEHTHNFKDLNQIPAKFSPEDHTHTIIWSDASNLSYVTTTEEESNEEIVLSNIIHDMKNGMKIFTIKNLYITNLDGMLTIEGCIFICENIFIASGNTLKLDSCEILVSKSLNIEGTFIAFQSSIHANSVIVNAGSIDAINCQFYIDLINIIGEHASSINFSQTLIEAREFNNSCTTSNASFIRCNILINDIHTNGNFSSYLSSHNIGRINAIVNISLNGYGCIESIIEQNNVKIIHDNIFIAKEII